MHLKPCGMTNAIDRDNDAFTSSQNFIKGEVLQEYLGVLE
jgi:hypothetical protein